MRIESRQEKIARIMAEMRAPKNAEPDEKEIKRNKNEKRIIAVCSSYLAVILAVLIVVGSVANHYFGKLNFGDVEDIADNDVSAKAVLDSEEEIDFDVVEYKQITETQTTEKQTAAKKQIKPKTVQTERYTQKKKTVQQVIEKNENLSNSNLGKEIQKKANEDIKDNIVSDGVWYSEDVYNLLIVGYDAGAVDNADADTPKFLRSDAIIIASVNYVKKTVKLVSLSRATYAAIPGHGNKRINTAHAYGGAKMLVDTIELNYKVKIDRYITCDFAGFEAIVDTLDGVTIDMTKTEADFAFDDESLPAGKYKMNGHQALRYVRLRKTDSDRTRTGRQRKVLKEIMSRAKKMNTSQKLDFMENVLPYVTTNFTRAELISKATELETYLSWPMTQYVVPRSGTQAQMRDGMEVLILDWEDTTDYIHSIIFDGVKVKTEPVYIK